MKTLFVVSAVILAMGFTACRKQEMPVPVQQATSTHAVQVGERLGPVPVPEGAIDANRSPIPCPDR